MNKKTKQQRQKSRMAALSLPNRSCIVKNCRYKAMPYSTTCLSHNSQEEALKTKRNNK